MPLTAIALTVLVLSAPPIWPQDESKNLNLQALLILPFDNATGQAEFNSLKTGIPDFLSVALAVHSDAIQVVERARLDAIIAEQGLKWENVMKDKAYGRLGQLTQAHYILRGSFMPDPQGLRIEALLYETETTRLLKTFEARGPQKSLNAMSERLVVDLIAAVIPEKGALPVDADPETHLHMARGLASYHQGEYYKAIPEFMKILAVQPRLADAKYWLYKSYMGAGLKDSAEVEGKEFLQFFPNDPRSKEIREAKP